MLAEEKAINAVSPRVITVYLTLTGLCCFGIYILVGFLVANVAKVAASIDWGVGPSFLISFGKCSLPSPIGMMPLTTTGLQGSDSATL